MTREEAIKILTEIQTKHKKYIGQTECNNALNMAIEALTYQNLSKPNNTCEVDLISREDAIEEVAQQWLFEASAGSPYVNDDDIGEYRNLAERLFEDVPSAEPVKHGEWKYFVNGSDKWALCSECGVVSVVGGNYCPNCGAKMDKD